MDKSNTHGGGPKEALNATKPNYKPSKTEHSGGGSLQEGVSFLKKMDTGNDYPYNHKKGRPEKGHDRI